MKPLALNHLWLASAALVAGSLLFHFFACERLPRRNALHQAKSGNAAAPERPPALRYTFVGRASLDTVGRQTAVAANPVLDAAPKTPASPSKPSGQSDSSRGLHRREAATPAAGEIPDFDIHLAEVDLAQVIRHYGYVPAVKTRDRLLGKIAGTQFLPLTPAEMSRYARRGRTGAGHPEAGPWRRRIAAELQLPVEELQFIFLVPHATEQLFIAAERAALARAGKAAAEVALIRAHFAADLAIVVDELVARSGAILAVDSVRVPSP